jgi:hypothetical protein
MSRSTKRQTSVTHLAHPTRIPWSTGQRVLTPTAPHPCRMTPVGRTGGRRTTRARSRREVDT